MGFPGGSAGEESVCIAGNQGSILGLGRSPGERKGYPLQYSGLENSMDYIVPWGHKESDTTEQLSLSLHSHKLCCTPETNIMLYAKYTTIKKNLKFVLLPEYII